MGIAGVAPEATLLVAGIPSGKDIAYATHFCDALMWATKKGADIISCSQKLIKSNLIDEAIEYAYTNGRKGKGTLMAAAAGNSYTPKSWSQDPKGWNSESNITYPASLDCTIAVGALDTLGYVANFSSRGPEIDMVAPGTKIYSSWYMPSEDYRYRAWDGTSQAAPHVVGIGALVLSLHPTLTAPRLAEILKLSCKKIGEIPYEWVEHKDFKWNCQYGHGAADALQALLEAAQTNQ